jgi:hypothetical protein
MAPLFKALAGLIPWADVMRSAPAILAAAKDLIEGAPKSAPPPPEPEPGADSPDETLQALRRESALLRSAVIELQADSRRQAEVIERLAEQNQRLAVTADILRRRLKLAIWIAAIAFVLGAACIAMLLLR